jgi:hypothetical protein
VPGGEKHQEWLSDLALVSELKLRWARYKSVVGKGADSEQPPVPPRMDSIGLQTVAVRVGSFHSALPLAHAHSVQYAGGSQYLSYTILFRITHFPRQLHPQQLWYSTLK